MQRPPVPDDARAALVVWTTDEGFDHELHVADGEDVDEVVDLLRTGVAEVLEGRRDYGLDDHVWLAQLVLRGKHVGCGYGTLDAEGPLLRCTLRDLVERGAAVLATAVERHVAERRLAIVTAVDRALERWDLLSALVGAAGDRSDAVRRLASEPFRCDEAQAEHVLDLRLGYRTRQAREDVRAEIAKLQADLADLP